MGNLTIGGPGGPKKYGLNGKIVQNICLTSVAICMIAFFHIADTDLHISDSFEELISF